ncbi:MAG TPA: dual specificity protein phosphatase [Phototrophicaceae bacterium]|jgi:hypothetical protein|nr:dual specificity protein phosphatase [Phototrophicaceae bacterium]
MYFVRDWLAIGKFAETSDLSVLRSEGITAMLQLAAPVSQPEIGSLYLAVEDGQELSAEMIERGTDYVVAQHNAGQKVLVACGAGISRSTTFTMATLMRLEGLELFETYRQILAVHPQAFPHPELCISLGRVYGLELNWRDVSNKLHELQIERKQ